MQEPIELFVLECPHCKRRFFVSRSEFCEKTKGAFEEYSCPFRCGPGSKVIDLAYCSSGLDSAIALVSSLYKKSQLLPDYENLSSKDINSIAQKVIKLIIEENGKITKKVGSCGGGITRQKGQTHV